jgi:hypothetical protein
MSDELVRIRRTAAVIFRRHLIEHPAVAPRERLFAHVRNLPGLQDERRERAGLRSNRDGVFQLIISELLSAELTCALAYPNVCKRIPTEKAAALVSWVRDHATLAEDPPGSRPVTRTKLFSRPAYPDRVPVRNSAITAATV